MGSSPPPHLVCILATAFGQLIDIQQGEVNKLTIACTSLSVADLGGGGGGGGGKGGTNAPPFGG